MVEDNEGLELELISFFRASTVSRLHSCAWWFSACLVRFARRGLKRERLLVAGNKALVVMQSRVKLVRIALISRGGKGVAFISKRKKRSQKISTVFQILEFCPKSNWKMSSLHVQTIHSNTLLNCYTFWVELLNSMMREKTQLRLFLHPPPLSPNPFFAAVWKASGKRICHQRTQTEEVVQYSW